MYQQIVDPLHNIGLSALIALIPIIFFFIALVVLKIKAYIAGFLTTAIAIILALVVYGMPLSLSIASAVHGAVYGLFPIGWIVFNAVFLYNMTVKTGQFEIIKKSIASITDDRRLQVLLIAFCFGAFLEGAAGFGTPVAITAAMLIGLGFEGKYAACMSLLANTAPVAFGGLGIPILVGAEVAGIDANSISKQLALVLPFLALLVPFYLVLVMSGFKGVKEIWPAVLVCAVTFAGTMFLTAYFVGPILPDITAAIVSLICLSLFLKVWQPNKVWRFENDPVPADTDAKPSFKEIVYAWSPFIILIIFIGNWGYDAVSALLDTVTVKFSVPVLNQAIVSFSNSTPIPVIFKFNWLSAAGTAIFIAAMFSAIIARMPMRELVTLFKNTFTTLRWSLVTIAMVLAYAYVGNNSGMTTTMGYAIASTGTLFPLVACLIGWIGVFVTGSDTSANALFGKLQTTAFDAIHSLPILGITANLAGGGVGKMISPQSIAIAAAATGLEGREGELYRFSLRHSVVLLIFMCIIIYAIHTGYADKNIFQVLTVQDAAAAASTASKAVTSAVQGLAALGISLLIILGLGLWVKKN